MVDKLHEYEGLLGRLHQYRDEIKERWQNRKSEGNFNIFKIIKNVLYGTPTSTQQESVQEDFSHVYR